MAPPYGGRVTAAALLAACALLLRLAAPSPARHSGTTASGAGATGAAAVVDSLLHRFGVATDDVRTWMAKAAGEPTGRIEERIPVPPSFRSLEFNHALARRLAPLGMSVVATERSRENSVTMHIVRGGVTIRSLQFTPEER